MKKWMVCLLTFVCLITNCMPVFAAAEVNVFFSGNGGTFDYYMDGVMNGEFFGDSAEVGTTIGDKPNAVLTDPVYWTSSRQFLGWMPYLYKNPTGSGPQALEGTPLETAPISSQDALKYVIPNVQSGYFFQFDAQWSGKESDYYSDVTFHGFGVDVVYTEFIGTINGIVREDVKTEKKWNYLKESTDSIKTQIAMDYEVKEDPKKANATFEGWMELSVEKDASGTEKYELISASPITTNEMLARTVPSYDVVFVAKWSDVEMKDYYNYFNIKVEDTKKEQRVDISNGLQAVPSGVADKYNSTTAIEKALAEKAINANENFAADKVHHVLMDIKLQYKDASGNWQTVTYDNFPTEGVEAIISYPEGTNKDDFDFVVTHMISEGEKAGEIEIMNANFEEDGIHVKFTSMSPVMIMYQSKNTSDTPEVKPTDTPTPKPTDTPKPTVTPKPADTQKTNPNDIPTLKPTDAPTTDTTAKVTPSETGDMNGVWSVGMMLLLSGSMLMGLVLKRKTSR